MIMVKGPQHPELHTQTGGAPRLSGRLRCCRRYLLRCNFCRLIDLARLSGCGEAGSRESERLRERRGGGRRVCVYVCVLEREREGECACMCSKDIWLSLGQKGKYVRKHQEMISPWFVFSVWREDVTEGS